MLIDLSPILELVVRDFQSAQATTGRVTLHQDPAIPLWAKVKPDAFAIALRNVMQNGLTHGARDSAVSVTASEGPSIVVRNNGRSVPAEVLGQLGTRFVRGQTGTNGTGLGMSIVKASWNRLEDGWT